MFGHQADVVEAYLAEWEEEEEKECRTRIAHARDRFRQQYELLSPEAVEALNSDSRRRWELTRWLAGPPGWLKQLDACPACNQSAEVRGEYYVDYEDVGWHKDGTLLGGHPVVKFTPSSLGCGMCKLSLDSASLVRRSNAMDGWELCLDEESAILDFESDDFSHGGRLPVFASVSFKAFAGWTSISLVHVCGSPRP